MSNILKEPYEITVWEEELIPRSFEYSDENGNIVSEEEYRNQKYKQNWVQSQENSELYYYLYDSTTSIGTEEYNSKEDNPYSKKIIIEHYEETNGIIIGAHDMDSPYAAVNPILKENVNGSVDLTFTLYYKIFDPDLMDFNVNPFVSMNLLSNEAKVKLNYRGKWHNLIIKNRVEDSTNYTFTYTCKDLYVNELNKNGFKVELDTELENNQGTVTELATTILEDTDWEVVPTEPLKKDADDENIYSDAIVETKIEPLYVGVLNQDITVSKLSNYTPDELVDGATQVESTTIEKGNRVLFFYSDVANEKKNPQILCRFDGDEYLPVFDEKTGKLTADYETDVNEDIITNACNYEIISPEVYYIESETEQKITNIVEEGFDIVDLFRGEKVIKSQKSGYDPDLDQFIFKYRKLGDDGNPIEGIEYYGYTKTEVLKSDLAQNVLANSDDFTTTQSGWYFDGVPAQTTKTKGVEKTAAYSGQLFNLADDNLETRIDSATPESVLVLQLKNQSDTEDYYRDIQGEFYKVTTTKPDENNNMVEVVKWLKVGSEEAKAYEDTVRHSFYDRRSSGIEGYADKTDGEIDSIVSEFLKDNRYSTRSRYAINNGVAANRKVIGQLTPGEEYLFAVSLGKFKDGEEPPEYGKEIKYGTTPPSAFYEFSDSENHNTFVKKAAELACAAVDKNLENDPYAYYIKNTEYATFYNGKYKVLCSEAEKEYEKTYIWGLNSVSSDAKDKLRRGGSEYREIFLDYLRGETEFSYNDNNIKICEYIAEKIIAYADSSRQGISVPAKELYEIFISDRELNDNENFERYDYYGMYPTMIKASVDAAIVEQKKLFTINSKWEPIEYSPTYFPQFDNDAGDIITTDASFCEKLFSAFYRELREVYIVRSDNGLVWNTTELEGKEESELTSEIETILKIVYKNAYENGKFLKVYNQAKDYKMPSATNPEGGAIYRAYKQEWEANAHKIAKDLAFTYAKVEKLFSKPDILIKLAPTEKEKEEVSSLEISEETSCNTLKDYTQKFLEYKNDFDAVNKDISTKKYEEEMLKWIGEILNDSERNSYYYYLLFFPYFIQYWLEEQEISTYTLADERYELNKVDSEKPDPTTTAATSISRVEEISISTINGVLTEKPEANYNSKSYITTSDGATHVAIKTNYNPYTNEGDDNAGGYVFDKNEQVIRLFDPQKDLLGALYEPVLDEKGDYIYDIFEQKYRPFRNWSIKEKRHPVTGEKDDELGLYGDVDYHKTKLFDGRLGKWQEEPVRYRMVRTRKNPIEDDYKFLTSEYNAPIFEEISNIANNKDNKLNLGKKTGWFMRYPKGYQCDIFEEVTDKSKKGKYVKIEERKGRKTIFSLQSNNNFFVLNSDGKDEETNGITNREKNFFGFSSFLKWLFRGKDTDETGEQSDGIQDIINNSESATLISNVNSSNQNYYDEDRISILVLDTGEEKTIELPVFDNIENKAEIYAAQQNGVIWYNVPKEGENTPDIPDTVTVTYYTKYKPFYWRHWGKPRYNLKPKLCILHDDNGVKTFKPFNCVEDVISDDYKILTINDYNSATNKSPVAFFLKDQERSFRFMGDADYGAVKYRMELQLDETLSGRERLIKDKEFWVESPNGENYLRKYKRGDGEVQLWDGHFGRVVECFKEVEAGATDRIVVKTPENNSDKKDGWYDSEEYPGLVEYYNSEGKRTVVALPDFYIYYDNLMIPYDDRVLGAKNRFTRQRVPYEEGKELYVYQDGQYIPFDKYYDKNGFSDNLNYDGLKVSFIKDFKYNALNFSIEELPEDRNRFLTFDLAAEINDQNKIIANNDGVMDLVVLKTDEKTIKERWIYWKSSVKEGISLTEDPLQSFGVLFEYTGSNIKTNTKKFPFLGMQLFKYIPYETSATELITREFDLSSNTDSEELKKRLGVDIPSSNNDLLTIIYNKLYEVDENNPNKFQIKDEKGIYRTLKNNSIRLETVKKHLSEKSIGLIDKGSYFAFEDISEQTIIVPLFPGELPDAKKLIRTKYYLYNPDTVTDADSVVYEYVGIEPPETLENGNKYAIDYDPQCQKVRSIKGKESNYFKLLQDCCDTFDCWIDPMVAYDEFSGKIKYVTKPVYVQTNVEVGEEPQTYIGEATKLKKVDARISRLLTKYGDKIIFYTGENNNNVEQITEIEDVLDTETEETLNYNTNLVNTYIWNPNVEFEKELENEEELKELNRLILFNNNYEIQYIKVPDKKIRFKRYVGKENFNGYKYGVNLKHIKRTIDSNQISTRVIVKANKNENGKDGFCTIQRGYDNPIKENFILDFSYYTQLGLLDAAVLNADLYTNVNSKLNYYGKLARLNKDNDAIIEEYSGLQIDYANVSASYETAVLGRDAAAEEISKLALNLTNNYDNYGQIIDSPWTFNKHQEYTYKRQTSAPATTYNMTIDLPNEENPINVKISAPATATQIEYPKYNEALCSLLQQMDELQREYKQFVTDVEKYGNQKKDLEAKLLALSEKQKVIIEKKNQLNKLFYHKYSRFIQEGSWIDENYLDDNLYYLDALAVARTSSKPKITYDIGVVDLSAAVEYEEDKQVLENEIGDRTYVEDTEFFGYRSDKVTPYWEEVVVSEKIYYLDDPAQNQVKVKNYTTQFDDLFQRIAATSQTLQFNEGSFNRAAALVQEDGSLDADALQKTIASGDFIISTSINEEVQTDNTGITITNSRNSNVIKLVSRGILISSDGSHYTTVIDGTGINADLITSGAINTGNLLIGDRDKPNFFWDKLGISAFRTEKDGIDYSSFVRLDQFGIYGIKNYNQPEDKSFLSYQNSFEPKSIKDIVNEPGSVFGLTWDGFFLNASNGTGRVTIGTEQDFKMSEFSVAENRWKDRVIIGRLDDGAEGQYYGFRLQNENNEIVMDTNDRGELYLKNKLRISNFNDMETYSPYEYIEEEDENGNITIYYCEYTTDKDLGNIKKYYIVNQESGRFEEVIEKREQTDVLWQDRISKPQDRVTLGIVDTYLYSYNDEEGQSKRFLKTSVNGAYSSTEYLTKVMSIKRNGFVKYSPFNEEEISRIIDVNETFAIFDNGNLYAKNAWIEGHINATSGSFTGHLEALTGKIGNIFIINEGLQSEKYEPFTNTGWRITKDGNVEFNNGTFHGKIQATSGYISEVMYVGSVVDDNENNIDDNGNNVVKIGNIKVYTLGEDEITDIAVTNRELKKVFSVTNKTNLIAKSEYMQKYLALKENENETFAIFDNGQFHARNAYIKGHIEAESGSFTGTIIAQNGEIGDIVIANGGIQSEIYVAEERDENGNITTTGKGWRIAPSGDVFFSDGTFNGIINAAGGTIGGIDISQNHIGTTLNNQNKGWQINSDGTAEFRNVNVSGKITSTIFEYDKVQTVAGSMLIRPAIYFTEYNIDDKKYILTLDSKSVPEEFQTNNLIKFGKEFKYQNCPIYKIVGYTEKEKNDDGFATITLEPYSEYEIESDYLEQGEKIILHMGKEGEEVIGLGLNASNNGAILPPESFSLISLNKDEQGENYKAKVILGKLPDNVLTAFKGSNYISEEPEYGLYADNVYLKGEIIATAGKFTGEIEATTGKIGELIIEEGSLQSQNYNEKIDENGEVIQAATEGWRIKSGGEVDFKKGTIGNVLIEDGGLQSNNYTYEEDIQEGEVAAILRTGWRINPNGDVYFSKGDFENCNMYNINAISGKIGGITIGNNSLSSQDSLTGWKIDASGKAVFGNLSLNGEMIVYPSTVINSISFDKENEKVTFSFSPNLELQKWLQELEQGSVVKFKIASYENLKEQEFTTTYENIKINKDISTQYDITLENIQNFEFNSNEILSFVPISNTLDSNYGIIINNSFYGQYPSKSISITEIVPEMVPETKSRTVLDETPNIRKTKLILGYLDEKFLTSSNISKDIYNTYGLYCDNVWLQGNLVASSNSDTGIVAGVSTSGLVKFSIPGEVSKNTHEAVFFSGYYGENPKFAVSKDGYLYAQNGYFQGKISTSEIIGVGTEGYGLTFKHLNSAMRFVALNENKEEYEKFVLNSDETSFYDSSQKLIFSILSGASPSIKIFESSSTNQGLLEIFRNSSDEIEFQYKNKTLLSFSEGMVKLNGSGGSSLGSNAYAEDVYVQGADGKNIAIGTNFVLL